MSGQWTVGAIHAVDGVEKRLRNECQRLGDRGFQVELDVSFTEAVSAFSISFDSGGEAVEDDDKVFIHYFAYALADAVLDVWEQRLLRVLIRHQCPQLSWQERRQVLTYTENLLQTPAERLKPSDSFTDSFPTYSRVQRKSDIIHELVAYFQNHSTGLLDGLVNFRLSTYRERLNEMISHAVEDFILDKGYDDFVGLLRYFIDQQPPEMQEVHVLFRKDGSFSLLNAEGDPVENEYLDEFMWEIGDDGIDYEDLLISALITVAPEEVVFHGLSHEKMQSHETIRRVFGARVGTCSGCSWCRAIESSQTPPDP